VSEEPFNRPGKKPPPIKYYRPGSVERLWEIVKDGIRWTAALRLHGENHGGNR
jgi:hypothetical protein